MRNSLMPVSSNPIRIISRFRGSAEAGSRLSSVAGQSTLEYLLVTIVIVLLVLGAFKLLEDTEYFYNNLTKPITAYLKYNYKYGDETAIGWDEGGPRKHIQISRPNAGNTFRIFIPNE